MWGGSGFYAVSFVRLFSRTLFNIATFQRLLGFCSWLFPPVRRFTTYNPARNNQTRLRRRVLMYFNKIGFCAVRALFSLKQKTHRQTNGQRKRVRGVRIHVENELNNNNILTASYSETFFFFL